MVGIWDQGVATVSTMTWDLLFYELDHFTSIRGFGKHLCSGIANVIHTIKAFDDIVGLDHFSLPMPVHLLRCSGTTIVPGPSFATDSERPDP